MFDLAWSEIALIGVVALIAIGPKDLPIAIKAVAGALKKARRMAAEFQGHVDEMVREADLHEVRDQFNDLRNIDIKGKILNAVDNDGTLRRTINENPFSAPPPPVTPVSDAAPGAAAAPEPAIAAPEPPAFIPPAFVPPAAASLVAAAAAAPPMIPPVDVAADLSGTDPSPSGPEPALPASTPPASPLSDRAGPAPAVQRERAPQPASHA